LYFGSVKFFKHLIIGVVALLIIIPVTLCIIFGAENSGKSREIAALEEQIAQLRESGAVDPSDPKALLDLYEKSDEKEEFLRLLSESDAELYASFVKTVPAMNISDYISYSAPGETTAAPSQSEEITSEESAAVTAAPETTAPFRTTSYTEPAESPSSYTELYPELYCYGTSDIIYDADEDYLYLTFDDGPSKYTENILYYLDKYNIKATFFVVPSGSDECNRLLKKIADAGHTIGIHSASHVYNEIYASVEAYLEDFKTAYDRVYNATGIKCELFRFPGGSINDYNCYVRDEIIEEMTRRGFIYFDWNVDSEDALGATWTQMYTNVLSEVEGKTRAVILMHDHNGGYNTILVLEDIIKALINDERCFKFGPLTKNVRPLQF